MVTGSTTIPLSYFLTLVTSSACCAGDMFLWMNPMPPACAMAIAVRASVTVSIAALTSGICSRRFRVSWALTSTCRGRTSLSAGSSRTSSNVRAIGRFGSSISAPTRSASVASRLPSGNARSLPLRTHIRPPLRASARPAARPRSGFSGAVAGGAALRIGVGAAAAGDGGEGWGAATPDSAADEGHGDPEDDDGKDDEDDADLDFLRVLPGLAEHAVLAGPVSEQHPARRRGAGGDAVVEEELPVGHPGGAGDEVGHRAHSGEEAGHHDELRAVALEQADDPLDLLARDVPADASLEQRLAVGGAGAEDDGIADQDPGQADQDHGGERSDADGRTLPGQVAAGDERDVLRKRQGEAARDQQRENAHVPGRAVELQKEVVDCLVQSAAPLWTNVRAYPRPFRTAT